MVLWFHSHSPCISFIRLAVLELGIFEQFVHRSLGNVLTYLVVAYLLERTTISGGICTDEFPVLGHLDLLHATGGVHLLVGPIGPTNVLRLHHPGKSMNPLVGILSRLAHIHRQVHAVAEMHEVGKVQRYGIAPISMTGVHHLVVKLRILEDLEVDSDILEPFMAFIPDDCGVEGVSREDFAKALYKSLSESTSDADAVTRLESYIGADAGEVLSIIKERGLYGELRDLAVL